MEQTVGVFYEFFVSFSLKLCERVYPHHFTRSMGLVAGALRGKERRTIRGSQWRELQKVVILARGPLLAPGQLKE